LLVPALLLDERCWDRVLPLLRPDIDVDFVDRPIGSQTIDAESSLRAYEDALLRRIEREKGARPVFVAGSSLGGYIAARVVARAEGAVTHCVAVAGLARMPSALVDGRLDAADRLERGELAFSDVIGLLRDGAISPEDRDAESERLLSLMLGPLTCEQLVRDLRLTAPLRDPAWGVPALAAPMTLMHGRHDQTVPFTCGEELAALGRDARLVVLETSSHVLPLSHPSEVASELNAIVAR
jgi:pimeloyl-ACP methyl ester carboxylesterase